MIKCEARITKELKRGRHHSTPGSNPASPVQHLPVCGGDVTLRIEADLEPIPVVCPVITVVAVCSRCRSAWWKEMGVLLGNPALELANVYSLFITRSQRAEADTERQARATGLVLHLPQEGEPITVTEKK